ncbi:hypothetical protein KUL25_10215 [Rhodobacteraceae bacterium N5(2021)]|uniref:Rap1a immunity protein domain-containing protein n=1 Tax=Gymnodinialimonas phycosphaerae TaxID=2841589 RepID=A0A975YHW8_9RHOB|nr:Rap1a/Tai family immunity protein [Gymnodinialimonas phycosphaerae]MBY4893138.1 hypothetical protein [Gymnodinialimonas phycosphaerae]
MPMRVKLPLWVAVMWTCTLSPAAAETTVEEIMPACEAALDESYLVRRPAGFCIGFITGVWQMMAVNCLNPEPRAALPVELQAGDIPSWRASVQAFLNWAEDHPEQWDETFFMGTLLALSSTFPCEE